MIDLTTTAGIRAFQDRIDGAIIDTGLHAIVKDCLDDAEIRIIFYNKEGETMYVNKIPYRVIEQSSDDEMLMFALFGVERMGEGINGGV